MVGTLIIILKLTYAHITLNRSQVLKNLNSHKLELVLRQTRSKKTSSILQNVYGNFGPQKTFMEN